MKLTRYLAAALLVGFSTLSFAQGAPGLKEGKDYVSYQVKDSLVNPTSKKPAVVEFFWYGCPHCFKMKPLAEAVIKKYGQQVDYIRYPVAFPEWDSGTRLFFALESLNLVDKFHDKIFNEVQANRNNILDNKNARMAFFSKNGVDAKKVEDALTSFAVNTKVEKAKKMLVNYKVESSPVYAVYSKGITYQVSPSLVQSYEKTAENVDKLLAQALKK